MVKKLIVVGCTTQENKLVNGHSMMFQLFVDKLAERKIETVVVDFGKSLDPNFSSKRVSGKFSFTKLADNFLLIFKFLNVLILHPHTPVYITTSQSKVGFIRDFIFINLAKLLGRKVVAHQFGANYEKFYAGQSVSLQHKIKSTLAKADRIIVEGDFTKKQFSFLENYESKVISIPNGLPEKIDSAAISPKALTSDQPVQLLYLSNLIESKGYWDVLEAINILVNREGKNIKAIFSGKFLEDVDDKLYSSSDEARKAFFEYIKKNNLETNIDYFDGLYANDKKEAFKKSHFFILPSYYINEGQPVSVVEALAYGCIPIVTEYRLIPDMVNRSNGFFVPKKSPEDIVTVVLCMFNDKGSYKERSAAGIQFYKDNFTAEKYIDKILALFD